jgi:glycosyltransferase involved in cell wall biosynthesis
MKVVWICILANEEIGEKINSDLSLSVSSWMTEFIDLFKNNKHGLEITVISPNLYSNKEIFFVLNDIKVILIKYRPNFLPAAAYNLSLNYGLTRKKISALVDEINPDIIHLFGSENPIYAASFLNLYNKFPILLSVQGFVSLSSKPPNIFSKYVRWNRIRFEKKINSLAKNITVATKNVTEQLSITSPNANFYPIYYPTTIPKISADVCKKEYDLVYYSRIVKDKGIEDFISALDILNKTGQDYNAIVIGGGAQIYIDEIKKKVSALGLTNKIRFTGFLETQQEVFRLAAKAKVYVLPTYFDGIPGTIREAMMMRLPVIAYSVGGIPTFNADKKCITLVEKQNIDELAVKIRDVLTDLNTTKSLVENAYELMQNQFSNKKIYGALVKTYKNVLKQNHND